MNTPTLDDSHIPKNSISPKTPKKSFEEVLASLKPTLEKLPPEQIIPPLPPDKMALQEVDAFVTQSGMVVPDNCPHAICLGGEFIDRTLLREGRVGAMNGTCVLSFLYKYAGKSLQAIVLHPRGEINLRYLGQAIWWGRTADVPEDLVQTQTISVSDFFSINCLDLSKLVNMTHLERLHLDYQKKLDGELKTALQWAKDWSSRVETLEKAHHLVLEEKEEQRGECVTEFNRAEKWKMASGYLFVITITITVFIFRGYLHDLFLH